ncbi:protein alp1-like [Plakobranchus ocellatus]|uniref:Protein alp1-like n=1 Tax=Plakobranchus ocellatus TaxID=259542 RepID=A0AAV3YC26_9GAST|nr:protein alp1-like [Plakobranchus ocellatus]
MAISSLLGAVDGKHVAISPPPDSGSYFYNYKGFHSLLLMAIANANYEFIYVHFGTNGRVSDGGVIACTSFYKMLKQGNLNLPEDTPEGFPFVFVGDEAFALREDFLKPFKSRLLNDQRRIFNFRLSRARRVVENTFGILVARFGVLKSRICLNPENIDDVVMACCVMHNFLRIKTSEQYTPQGSLDVEDPETHILETRLRPDGANIAALARGHTRNAPTEPKRVRDLYTNYFNNDGKVPWQDKIIVVTVISTKHMDG